MWCEGSPHIFRCDTAPPEKDYCDGTTKKKMLVRSCTSISYCDACLEIDGITCGYKKRYPQDMEEEGKGVRERCGTMFEHLAKEGKEGRKEKGKDTEDGERVGERGILGEAESPRAGERSDEGQQFGKGKQSEKAAPARSSEAVDSLHAILKPRGASWSWM